MNTTIDPQNCVCHAKAPDTRNTVERLIRQGEEKLDWAQTVSESTKAMHWEGPAGEHYRDTLHGLYYDVMCAKLSFDTLRQLAWG